MAYGMAPSALVLSSGMKGEGDVHSTDKITGAITLEGSEEEMEREGSTQEIKLFIAAGQ